MGDDTTPRTKVGRVIERYGLDGMGGRLEAEWTGRTGERTSLRDLADRLNRRILEARIREMGSSPSDFEITSIYEALHHGTGSEEIQARRRLERQGIDTDALRSDFITHTAVHTYLTESRGVSLPPDDQNLRERKIETIEKLRGRVEAVSESAIASLVNAEKLNDDEYTVLVDIQVICPNCGKATPISELFREGGCECRSS
jgi:predicted transcriptional regulator